MTTNAASAMIKRLSGIKIRDLIQVWRNCVAILADPAKSKHHFDARRVIDAVNKEWARRGREPLKGDEYFTWPSTEATGGDGSVDARNWLSEGVLKEMGYKVGSTDGLAQNLRQKILAEVFQCTIPPLFPANYIAEWGPPGTSQRLRKMAETLAAFTRNARRRGSRMGTAVAHWEQDLEFLYYEYYVEKFYFAWPSTQAA